MKAGQDKRYTYATGRIRALEARLLNRSAFERLIEFQTLDEINFILKEYGLSQDLDENLLAGYKVLDELTIDKEIANSFRLKYDFHNLKVILKSKITGQRETGLSNLGIFELAIIRKMANKEKVSGVPFDYPALIKQAQGQPLQLLSVIIDRFMTNYFFGLFVRQPFLKDYFKKFIDLKNIMFYFRLKDKMDVLKEALLNNGYLKKGLLLRGFDIKEASRYDGVIRPGLELFNKEGSLDLFEKLCDDYLLNILKLAKYMPFGIEPLFSYVVAVEYQARSVNAILFSKKNGIPKEQIRRNLRESYA